MLILFQRMVLRRLHCRLAHLDGCTDEFRVVIDDSGYVFFDAGFHHVVARVMESGCAYLGRRPFYRVQVEPHHLPVPIVDLLSHLFEIGDALCGVELLEHHVEKILVTEHDDGSVLVNDSRDVHFHVVHIRPALHSAALLPKLVLE